MKGKQEGQGERKGQGEMARGRSVRVHWEDDKKRKVSRRKMFKGKDKEEGETERMNWKMRKGKRQEILVRKDQN